ncbi:hypothetical protein BC829DRAFT_406691 [Chytridium lagenaria]|nr:hypothetical protein BC829DRAFT_406691 [Chytridium lagenaria]
MRYAREICSDLVSKQTRANAYSFWCCCYWWWHSKKEIYCSSPTITTRVTSPSTHFSIHHHQG